MIERHAIEVTARLRAVRDGGGGRVAVVQAEPGPDAAFLAGLRRAPAATALEAVLRYMADEHDRPYRRILAFTGMNETPPGPHLPDLLVAAGLRVGYDPGAWEFRSPPAATPSPAPRGRRPGARGLMDEVHAMLEDDAREFRRAGPAGVVLATYQGEASWFQQLTKILALIDEAIGRRWDADHHEAAEPTPHRTLLILDDHLLLPRANQRRSVELMEPRQCAQLRDRLDSLPEAIRGTPVDLILLCRSAATVAALGEGRMLHDQLARLLLGDASSPDGHGLSLPRMHWRLDAPNLSLVVLGRLDPAAPFDPHLPGDPRHRTLYDALRLVPPRRIPDPMEELDGMVGLRDVKDAVRRVFNSAWDFQARRAAGLDPGDPPFFHMVFYGNPGTGKTHVARIVAGLLVQTGLISGRKLTQVLAADLIAGYVGQTRIQTRRVCEQALGGVLFIDEAYALAPGRDGQNAFGAEAIDELLVWMLERRRDIVFILAGYRAEMVDFLRRANPGLAGRIGYHIPFDDYSLDELCAIAEHLAGRSGQRFGPGALDVIRERLAGHIAACRAAGQYFRNAGEVEKLLLSATSERADRLRRDADGRAAGVEELTTLLPGDLRAARLDVLPGGLT